MVTFGLNLSLHNHKLDTTPSCFTYFLFFYTFFFYFETETYCDKTYLSYDIAIIQWITSCYKNCITTCVITHWHVALISLTTSVSAMCFYIEHMFILKAIKFHFKRSYDNQNFIFMVISYEIYETS